MANPHWEFVLQLIAGTTAKAEDVNANLAGIDAGFVSVTTDMDQAIKVINAPGTVDVNLNAAARANKILSFDGSGGILASIYIGNYQGNHAAAAGTVYNVRDTVKDSTGALGQDNIYICNASHTSTGTLLTDTANWDLMVDVAAVSASAAASAASAAAALVSETNAATSYDNFDDRELGDKAADPTLDNDGNALLDGAQYWNTVLKRKKIYDLANTVWLLTTANAVDVNIADSGGLFNAINSEVALQEVMAAASGVLSTGTTAALVLTYGLPVPTSNDIYTFTSVVNALAAATLNIDSGGSKPLVNQNGVAIILGDIVAGGTYTVRANGAATWVVMNPTRSMEGLSVNTNMVVGNKPDIPVASLFSGTVPIRVGQSGLIVGLDAANTLTLNNNFYVNSGGTNSRLNDGVAAGLSINPTAVQIIVAPTALQAVAPVFKTPLSIDIATGVITVAEPAGFQALYQKPPLTTGTSSAYLAVLGITSYVVGTIYQLRIHATSAGATTLNIDGIGVQSIALLTTGSATDTVAGDLSLDEVYKFQWDGTDFILLNPSEITGNITATLTPGSGTITLNSTNNKLVYNAYRSTCRIQGAIDVSSISTPSGILDLAALPFPTVSGTPAPGVSAFACGQIVHQSLASAVSIGLALVPKTGGATILSVVEQTTTTRNLNSAAFIGAGTRLYINFEYMFRK